MITDVWWRARDEVRDTFPSLDIGGDPTPVQVFAQGAEAAGAFERNHRFAPIAGPTGPPSGSIALGR
jgi:hypothetical protein